MAYYQKKNLTWTYLIVFSTNIKQYFQVLILLTTTWFVFPQIAKMKKWWSQNTVKWISSTNDTELTDSKTLTNATFI